MIFFEHEGHESDRQNLNREALLVVLTALLAAVLLPFTVLLALFWLAWDLAPRRWKHDKNAMGAGEPGA